MAIAVCLWLRIQHWLHSVSVFSVYKRGLGELTDLVPVTTYDSIKDINVLGSRYELDLPIQSPRSGQQRLRELFVHILSL